jgi:threonine dehydrogenase-like Zn-dependent dehydrogenase
MLNGGLTDPRWVRFPLVPGHEWSGTVTEVGEGVTDLEVGARVICEGMIPCNRCRRCKEGATQLCLNYDQIGFTREGGYGEYVHVPRHVVHRLPEGVSFAAGALVEPASCVLRGLERGRPRPGDTIGVIGVGTLGSLAVTLSQLYSPGALVAYGVREEELELARRLGASATVHASEEDAVRATHDLLGGGLDLVIETAGAVAAVDLATRLARPGGRVVLLGIAGEGTMLEIPADRIMFADMDVIGSCSYPTSAWSSVVRLLERGLVDLDPIVTHRFPAERFEDAFAVLEGWQGTVAMVLLEHVSEA